MSVPAAKPRRTRRRWLWLFLAVPVVLVAIVLLVLQSSLVERAAREALERTVSGLIGEDLDVDRIELSYVPLRVTVRGVRLNHPADGANIVDAQSVAVTLGLKEWKPTVLKLELNQPTIQLHVDEDGLREFRGLPKGQGGGKLERFPWEELVVNDVNFALDIKGKDLVRVSDLDLVPNGDRADLSVKSIQLRFGDFERTIEPFTMAGLELAPDHVVIPSLSLSTDGLALEGTLSTGFGKDDPLSAELSAHVELPSLTTNKTDTRKFVDGIIDADISLAGTLAAPTAEGNLLARAVAVHGVNSKGDPFAREFGDVQGPFTYADKKLHVGTLQMEWDASRIGIEADVNLADWTVAAGVTGEDLSLGQILRRVGVHPGAWVDFKGDVEIHVSGTAKPLQLDGPFELNLVSLDVTQGAFDTRAASILSVGDARLAGEVHIDGQHFVIDADRADFGPTTRGRARADIGLKPEGPLLVEVEFDRLDLGDLAPLGDAGLGGMARAVGRLSGPFDGLHAELDLVGQDLQVLEFYWADRFSAHLESPDLKRLQFTDLEATLGNTNYKGNIELSFPSSGMELDTQIYITDGYLRDLMGIFVDLEGVDAKVAGTLVLGGPIYTMDGEAQLDLSEAKLYGENFETGHLTAWMDQGLFTLEELRLVRPEVGLLARGTVGRGWAMDMDVHSDGATLDNLDNLRDQDLPADARVTLDAHLGGTLFKWQPDGRVTLRDTVFAGKRVADSTIHFTTGEDEIFTWKGVLVGDSLAVNGTIGIRGDQPYTLHAAFTQFPLDLLYPVGADGSPVTARLSGTLDLGGQFGDNPTPVEIRGNFDQVYARWRDHELTNPEPWAFRMTGTEVTIPTLRLSGGTTDVKIDGQTSLTGYVALEGGGTVDLDLVRAFAPGVTEARGTVQLELGISGSREQGVDIAVTGRIKRGEVRTEFFPEPFEDIDALFTAAPDGYDIREFTARVGGGDATAYGRIDAEDWSPTRYDLHANVADARLKYFDSLPAMRGSAKLHFDGPVGQLQLGGRIDVSDMTWSERIPWEEWVVSLPGRGEHLTASASAEKEDYFGFDLDIVANRTVRMRNNVGDLDASVNLKVGGDTARPEMTGSITVDPGGLVYFNGRQLEVSRAEMRYLDPVSFDPDLDFVLGTDIRGQTQDYSLKVTVQGPMSEKKVASTGEGLSEADANSLLLTGMTVTEFERYGGIGAFIPQGIDLIGKQIGETNLVLIDRWNIVSGISERGSTSLSDEWRLVAEKNLEGFTITGETALSGTSDYYLGVERRITDNLVATLYWASRQQGRSLNIGGAYGAQFKYRWELD